MSRTAAEDAAKKDEDWGSWPHPHPQLVEFFYLKKKKKKEALK